MNVLHVNWMAPAVGALSLVGSWLCSSHGLCANRIPVLRAPEAQALQVGESNCSGSDDRLGRVELVPDAVRSTSTSARIEYHAEIEVKQGTNVGIAWTGEIVDDRGRLVQERLAEGTASGSAGQRAETVSFSPTLPDGFFALRVHAAVVTQDQRTDILDGRQYVRVRNGVWTELNDRDWRALSLATVAHRTGVTP
jgi:hypothetical protein